MFFGLYHIIEANIKHIYSKLKYNTIAYCIQLSYPVKNVELKSNYIMLRLLVIIFIVIIHSI